MDKNGPQCQVCLRTPDIKLPFFCPTCARNVLYELRIKLAQTLLNKEGLGREIELWIHARNDEVSKASTKKAVDKSPRGPSHRLELEQARSEATQAKARATSILQESQTTRSQIKKMRTDISKRKSDVASRALALKAARQASEHEEEKLMRPLLEETSAVQSSWDRLHHRTAEARVFLCREAAALYGLYQQKKKKGIPGRDLYLLGGVPVVDLRDLNNANPEQVTTSISRVAHLLHLTSHYLGLRLPAEISLATAFQPYCLIHTPLSSYKGIMSPPSTRNQPFGSHSTPRQRILQLDRPLHQLAAEEPIDYSLFVDAVTLLAWDIAWLAKTQGVEVGAKNWDDICALGKNMWNLFVAPPRPPTLRTRTTAGDTSKASPSLHSQSPSSPAKNSKSPVAEAVLPPPIPGQYSHSSSHSFLSSSSSDGGAEHLRGWRFANPVRIIDRYKSALLNERTGAEWEVLEKPESEDVEAETREPVNISTKGMAVPGLKTVVEDRISEEADSEPPRTRKGWTKLRSPSIDM